MKHFLVILFLLSVSKYFSQQVNYCDYFTLGVSEEEYQGQLAKSYWPVILEDKKDRFGKFLDKHGDRFDYILFREHLRFAEVGSYYPDSIKIKNAYCEKVIGTDSIQRYFTSLTPNTLVNWPKADTFSLDELMLTASKYFYCDGIDQRDTTVQWHVCVGINGQGEYKSNRDLTLLEAFSIEVIMHYLTKSKEPQFFKHFDAYSSQMGKSKRSDFRDFESYLLQIRQLCYTEMQHNPDLEKKLLGYYRKNRDNLNFVIIEN